MNISNLLLFLFIYYLGILSVDLHIFCLEIGLILSLLIAMYSFKKVTNELFSIYALFLSFFIIFLASRPILHLFGYNDIQFLEFYYVSNVSIDIISRAVFNQIIAIHSFVFGVIIYYSKCKFLVNGDILPINEFSIFDNKKVLYSFLIVGLFFMIKSSYSFYSQIVQKGYLALYTGDVTVDRSIWEWFLTSFYIIGVFYLISKPKVSSLFFSIFLLLIYVVLSMSTGQRGPGFLIMVFSLFYMYKMKRISISIIKLVILLLCISFVSVFISKWRADDLESLFSHESLFTFVFDFFWKQGISMHVLTMTIQFENLINYGILDLFGNIEYLIDYYYNKLVLGNNIDNTMNLFATKYKIFSTYISNIVDSNRFNAGYGLGGSYIAQFYAVGKEFAQFIGGIMTGLLFSFLYKRLFSDKFVYRFIAFYMLAYILYIPRDNWFDFFTENWIVYIAIFMIGFLNTKVEVSKKKKRLVS